MVLGRGGGLLTSIRGGRVLGESGRWKFSDKGE